MSGTESLWTFLPRCHNCGATGRQTRGFRSAEGICGRCGATMTSTPIPEECCPVCTKDLESDGWCFECRCYPRSEFAWSEEDFGDALNV